MPRTFLVFSFDTNEDAAQQARHRLDGWKQGFRLGNKVQFKIERLDSEPAEKHLFQQWLQRIPAEEPFKSAKPEAVHHGDPGFDKTSDLFDNLN